MRLGVVLARDTPPETIPELAALAEVAGFNDAWIAEDGFATGVASSAALALANTTRIRVALGVTSALVRHPAVLALEIATISRAYPNRFVAGIGVGVAPWLAQMGLSTSRQLAAVRECVSSLRDLLAGRTVNTVGEHFTFANVRLDYPPPSPVPLHVGAAGPRMLELAGEIADGTVLSVGASERYIAWADEHISKGRRTLARDRRHHELTVFAMYAVDDDREVARKAAKTALAHHLYHSGPSALTTAYGISEIVADLSRSDVEAFERAMPDKWIDDLAIAGDPRECVEKLQAFGMTGIHGVALLPASGLSARKVLELTGAEVRPHL